MTGKKTSKLAAGDVRTLLLKHGVAHELLSGALAEQIADAANRIGRDTDAFLAAAARRRSDRSLKSLREAHRVAEDLAAFGILPAVEASAALARLIEHVEAGRAELRRDPNPRTAAMDALLRMVVELEPASVAGLIHDLMRGVGLRPTSPKTVANRIALSRSAGAAISGKLSE